MLKQRRFFETRVISAEDRQRNEFYRGNQQRAELAAGAATVDDFLRGLEMVAEQEEVSEGNLARVEQLLARTNQWNLTTRRHGMGELAVLRARPEVLLQAFRLRDRCGDNGLVGLWIARAHPHGDWEIDTWLMSCRVIGRGLEDLMFNALVEMIRARGGRRLRGIYRATPKNGLVAGLLPRLGFALESGQADAEEQLYVLDLEGVAPRPHFIRLTRRAEMPA